MKDLYSISDLKISSYKIQVGGIELYACSTKKAGNVPYAILKAGKSDQGILVG